MIATKGKLVAIGVGEDIHETRAALMCSALRGGADAGELHDLAHGVCFMKTLVDSKPEETTGFVTAKSNVWLLLAR